MSYFTTDLFETKREIVNFSNYLTEGLSKADRKFVLDMQFGIARSQSVMLSEISRSLFEDIKLSNTIDRLSDHLINIDDNVIEKIKNRFFIKAVKCLDDNVIVNLDDSDIVKIYGKKFEDLDMVRDGSSNDDRIVPGYHIAEASVVTKNQKTANLFI